MNNLYSKTGTSYFENEKLNKIFIKFLEDENKDISQSQVKISLSDLHIRHNQIFIRKNNDLIRFEDIQSFDENDLKEAIKNVLELRYNKEITKEIIENFEKNKYELDFSIKIPNSIFRARVNIFYAVGQLGIVIRKIPVSIPLLSTLNIEELHLKEIKKIIAQKEGLVLITGQTGSGKSTTLAAIIDYINKEFNKHIITIEDPVEFFHTSEKSLITHREIGQYSDTKTFSTGLRSALREDPDIILIGELRDKETAEAALHAAQTGHIVFATLHTNSAAETVQRLVDIFPTDESTNVKKTLSTSLKLVISQRLAKNKKGTRSLVYEMMTSTLPIRNIINTDTTNMVSSLKNEMFKSKKPEDGAMILLNQNLIDKIQKNEITEEQALECSYDGVELSNSLKEQKVNPTGFTLD